MINKISDFCRQYQYLQLEKPSGVEVEIPVHKTLAMDFLKGGPTGPPLGSDSVKKGSAVRIISSWAMAKNC